MIGLAAIGLLLTILASIVAIMAQRKRWYDQHLCEHIMLEVLQAGLGDMFVNFHITNARGRCCLKYQYARWCWGERKGRFEPQPDIKIERRVERQVAVFVTIMVIMLIIILIMVIMVIIIVITRQESEQGSLGERTLPLTQGLGESIFTTTSINGIIMLLIFLNPESKC